MLGIFNALSILFPAAAQADAWLRRPNTAPIFGGRSALDHLMSANVADLYVVRSYLYVTAAVAGGTSKHADAQAVLDRNWRGWRKHAEGAARWFGANPR